MARARDQIVGWLAGEGVTAVIIIVVTLFVARFVGELIVRGFAIVERRAIDRQDPAGQRRLTTLSAITRRTAQAVVLFIGLLELLPQLDLNITPILASAGVVGLAVGFGAQSLIKDLFAGLLILIEDQYSVGDVVKIGETTGTVENLTLRATSVRNIEGSLTIIPNGMVGAVSNLSKGWSRAVLDFEIDSRENIDRASEVMLEAANQLKQDEPEVLISEPKVLGVDRVTKDSIVIRMTAKTAPGKHVEVTRELRRRVILAFDEKGIRLPQNREFILTSRSRGQGSGIRDRGFESRPLRRNSSLTRFEFKLQLGVSPSRLRSKLKLELHTLTPDP